MSSKVLGTAQVVRSIADVRRAAVGILGDAELAALINKRVKARFMQGVSPDGTPWPGLDTKTVERKTRAGVKKPTQLLYATGRLYNSIKIIQGSNAGLLTTNTGIGVRVGVSDPFAAMYGRFHNYGIGQEERQFIGLGRLDLVAVKGMLARKLKSISKR